ncbi:glycosyltransferase family 39 protein [Chryseolinea sp. T2]|uniref:ArnT family glycosyltransferase n=1 Tax=Chryseolinea sp. T2 TaxID=3129255 RepID=UPI003077110C
MNIRSVLIVVSVLCLLMLSTGNMWGVTETSEARYAEVSREMYRSGDWIHPTLLNVHHYHKPPLTYWLTALAYSIFGITPFAARFFLVIAFVVQVYLVFGIGKVIFKSEQSACYSSIVYATLPLVLVSVRGLTTDAYLTTFVLLSLYGGAKFIATRRSIFLYLMAFALGAGFITKGPAIIVVPFFAIFGLWRLSRKENPILQGKLIIKFKQIIIALLIFCVVGLTWFVVLVSEDAKFTDYFVFHHFVDRVAHAEVFARTQPWYYYLPIVPLVTFPWIIVFAGGLVVMKRKGSWSPIIKSLLTWTIVIPLIIFSIASSKLVLYILPLAIGFSLITGHLLAQDMPRRLLIIFNASVILINLCLMSVSLFYRRFITDSYLVISSALILVISLSLLLIGKSKQHTVILMSSILAMHLILFSALFFRLNSNEVNSLKNVTSYIREANLQNRTIIVYDRLLPSVAFELDKDIISVFAGDPSLKRETQFERDDQWKKSLLDATNPKQSQQLRFQLQQECVVIARDGMPVHLDSIMTGKWATKKFGKWRIYHN